MISQRGLDEYVRKISKSSPDIVVYCDREGNIVQVGSTVQKVLCYQEKELKGRSIIDFVEAEGKRRAKNMIAKAAQGKEALDYELGFLSAGGEPVDLHCSAYPLSGESRKSPAVLVLGKNLEKKEKLSKDFFFKEEGIASAKRTYLNKKLFEINSALEEKTSELTALLQVAHQVVSSLELEKTLEMIVEVVADLVQAKQCILMLYDERSESLVGKVGKGFSKKQIQGMRVQIGEGVSGAVAQDGKPLLVSAAAKGVEAAEEFGGYIARSLIVVPLKFREKTVGVINVMSRAQGRFDKSNLDLITLLANQAAIAVENAHLFALTEHLAVTDGVTGIYNYRYFQQRLEEEIRRAKRYGTFISLAMLDIDHFKKYNDTYGHPQGDIVLKQIAYLLKTAARETDIVARYGGEEFVVVLPETRNDDALNFAERVRRSIEGYPFAGKPKKDSVNLTISMGVSSYPKHARSGSGLIEKADQALYEAKRQGRNRVCAFKRK